MRYSIHIKFGWLAEARWLAGWQQLQPSLRCPAGSVQPNRLSKATVVVDKASPMAVRPPAERMD